MVKSYTVFIDGKIKCDVTLSLRSSISLKLFKNGKIILRAPFFTPKFIIQKFIENKKPLILEKIVETQNKLNTKHEKKYIEGESHFFLGKKLLLKIKIDNFEKVAIEDTFLIVTSKRYSPIIIKNSVINFFHEEGIRIIYERYKIIKKIFENEKIAPSLFSYKKMKGKWGYCTSDNAIFINPELVKTPIECIDYVIAHEFCHIKHHNHGKYFKALQKKMLPDFKNRVKLLRQFE